MNQIIEQLNQETESLKQLITRFQALLARQKTREVLHQVIDRFRSKGWKIRLASERGTKGA